MARTLLGSVNKVPDLQAEFQVHEPRVHYRSAETMPQLADESVNLVVTSPPYGQIKDYGIQGQIGFHDSFNDYFSRLKRVWEEILRVLVPQARLVINVGDQYLRATEYDRYRILSIASRIIEDCTILGFDFLGDIIWQKISTTNTTGGCSLMGSLFYPRNGMLTFDYEHILIFKKVTGSTAKGPKVPRHVKELSKICMDEWKQWYVGHWRFPGIQQKDHVAMFPEELPYRIIRMFSVIGDVILDPFAGSGTTLKVAKSLFRRGVGYEINPDFRPMIEAKLAEAQILPTRDFQALIYHLLHDHGTHFPRVDLKFSTQKSIIALTDVDGNRVVFDLLSLSPNDFARGRVEEKLRGKLDENNLQHFLKGRKAWADVTRFDIVVDLPERTAWSEIQRQFQELCTDERVQVVPFSSLTDPEAVL